MKDDRIVILEFNHNYSIERMIENSFHIPPDKYIQGNRVVGEFFRSLNVLY